ncbi:MAG: hypothetical protein ACI4RV_01360 [Eubacteriales bacterium]
MIMDHDECKFCDEYTKDGLCMAYKNGNTDFYTCIKACEKWLKSEAPEDVLLEYCAECGGYVEIRGHDVMRDGYLTKCPVCGHMMRLCRACAEDGGVCDKTDRDADVCFREEP